MGIREIFKRNRDVADQIDERAQAIGQQIAAKSFAMTALVLFFGVVVFTAVPFADEVKTAGLGLLPLLAILVFAATAAWAERGRALQTQEQRKANIVLALMAIPIGCIVSGLLWWAIGHSLLDSARIAAAMVVGGTIGLTILYWRASRRRGHTPEDDRLE